MSSIVALFLEYCKREEAEYAIIRDDIFILTFDTERMMTRTTLLLCTFFALAAAASAQEYTSEKMIAENAEVFRDFQIQGEYLETSGDEQTLSGYQIIANGSGGQFRIVKYNGGLPGAGWTPDKEKKTGTALLSADGKQLAVTLGSDQEDYQVVTGGLKKGDGTLKKVARKSPTLGQQPPSSAVIIITADGKKTGIITKGNENPEGESMWSEIETKPFEKKPYSMHVEFLLSYMPKARGQARSNSGVYVDERYECQVLDSFGLNGENNECGGIYQQKKPKLNMCFPPLTWQTYDIDFTPAQYDADGKKTANAKIAVKQNGVEIYEPMELSGHTYGRRPEAAEPLGLYLQGHGNKVQFRNVWLKYNE